VLVPEFDRYVDSYSQEIDNIIGVFGKKQEFFVRHKAEILLPAFATVDADLSSLKVLDVGCGNGMLHPHIAPALGALHGADVSGRSIAFARERNPTVRYATYDGEVLPYADATFDCAFAICVLHHVPVDRWSAFMKEVSRVVRPGGLVLIIEHNPFNPATQWVVNTCRYDEHAHLVRPRRLRSLLTAAGVERPWTKFVLFTPFAPKPFRTLDRMLAAVPLGAQYVMGGTVSEALGRRGRPS
jgi:SAM-dependent methyltransferase